MISEADRKRWFRKRVANLKKDGLKSSLKDDEAAAKEYFGQGVSRKILVELRDQHPEVKKPRGRPKKRR